MGLALYRLRAELRHTWRATVALALVIGVVGGMALSAAAGVQRNSSALTRMLESTAARDVMVIPDQSGFVVVNAIAFVPARRASSLRSADVLRSE